MSNKKINFSEVGGFPLTQDALAFMQDGYRDAIKGLAAVVGNKVIVSGAEEYGGGSVVADGWVYLNGELLPLVGGTKTSYVVIEEIKEDETFEDGNYKQVYLTRRIRFGSGPGQIPWLDFKRVDSMHTHQNRNDNPHNVTKEQVGLGNLPNEVSDSLESDSSEVLATTKALSEVRRMIPAMRGGSVRLRDYPGGSNFKDARYTITHNHNYGPWLYMVTGSLRSVGSNWNDDNDVIWSVANLTSNSFDLLLRDVSNNNKDLWFDYVLILKWSVL